MNVDSRNQVATMSDLSPTYQRLQEVVQSLNFGRIERLMIRNGEPCYEQPPHIVEEIKLASGPDHRVDPSEAIFTLKKQFAVLFAHLKQVRDGFVDIEVRHGLPFKLVLERCHTELRAGTK